MPPSLSNLMGFDVLNSREWAILLWSASFLYYVFFIKLNDQIVKSLRALVKTAFNWKILVPVILMVIYIYFMVQGLELIGIWDSSQLKNTIIWTVTVGFVSLGRIASLNDKHPLKTLLLDHLKIIAILEFVLNIRTFSFWVELVIVPVTSLLIVMSEISKMNKDTAIVHKVFSTVLSIIGIAIIISSLYNIMNDFGSISTIKTWSNFYTPPLLTVTFIPFLFILALIINYEEVFVRLQFKIKDEKVLRYAKYHSAVKFNFHIKLLKRWLKTLYADNTETVEGIQTSIQNILDLDKKERNPKLIDINEGWSPYLAKDFLKKFEISPGYYNPSTLGEWYAESPFIPLSDEIDANKVVYYIDGEEDVAKMLKLKLCINNAGSALEDHAKLLQYANELVSKALLIEIPKDIQNCIKLGNEYFASINNFVLKVQRGEWFNVNGDGYLLAVTITHQTWVDREEE